MVSNGTSVKWNMCLETIVGEGMALVVGVL